MRDKQAQGATLTVVLQKAKGLQRVNGLLEGPRPDVFVTVEVENEELFTSPLRYETINPTWTTEENGVMEGHAFDPCGVPEKLQFRLWDRISDKERQALGFALIRRKRLWDVCTTKNRTVGLQVIGRIGGTEIQATGELWVELRWEPRPFDPALNIDSSPDKWRPPTPEEVRPETPITDDESETSEMRAMRELEEQLAEEAKNLTPVLKLKKPDFEYKPLPAISDAMVRKPKRACACGFSCALEVDFLAHCLECEAREGDTVDLLLLMRTLDPEVDKKEAATRQMSNAPAPSMTNVLTLEAATPSKKKRKKKRQHAEAPAPAARMGRESYDAYPAEILTLEDIPGRPESAGLRLDGSALRSPFLNRPGSSRPGSRPGTANSDKSVTWKLPSLPPVKQSELGEVEDPTAFPAPLVNKDDGVKPRKKKFGLF